MTQTPAACQPWATGIKAITLVVDDLEAAKAFYRSVFELPAVFEGDTSCVFAFGGTVVNLLIASSAPELIDPAPLAAAKRAPASCPDHRGR